MTLVVEGAGPLADRIAVALADLPVACTVLLPGVPDADWTGWLAATLDRAAAAHRAGSTAVIIVTDPTTRRLAHDALTGSIGAMAIDFAPQTRVCLVDVAPGADADDVIAAIDYLAKASATTGQLLQISGR
jgi:hypothetical protein